MSAELINKISAKTFACLSKTSLLWSLNLYARYCLEVNIKLPSWFAILGFPVRIASLHPPKVFSYLAQTLGKMLAAANLLACEYSSLSSLLAGDVLQKRRLRLSDRKSILMTYNLSGIWSGALIGRRSSYPILINSYCLGMTNKRQRATKVKSKRDESTKKQSIFLKFFFRKSIWVLLELGSRRTQNLTMIVRALKWWLQC